jgi:hypothetical protein
MNLRVNLPNTARKFLLSDRFTILSDISLSVKTGVKGFLMKTSKEVS